jgi:hypothetical protein
MSELIEELTALENRLVQEQTELLTAMARQPAETPLTDTNLRRVADIRGAIEAVRTELAARLPREGYTRKRLLQAIPAIPPGAYALQWPHGIAAALPIAGRY